ncbi:hypothetical protein SPRG_04142 [Saprolegnia parasitica CBS 223.65]|uniref:PPPDE domain-containing protein n=1 Tax=Saprolegnia parasitica (strain CBS 223.65) TaxID=695850 RepID=A0A067CJN0_SAPPC|nr:hypothetical protein SPRG_04142 [Saprolegnia parasitica CBS 223.65]KDO30954.1 hypothetical protein SPRG_04142 [Saprolegnia parasitica CBS 223.65]|eukprot:XP_012198138.1 hypothetical protein SPRG_04142 [Saprolegnia parasitica CBS 223.65]
MAKKGKTAVILNVYDLMEANAYTHGLGLGAFHSGVDIAGDEYSFAGGAGIFTCRPKQADGAVFRESIPMGYFEGSSNDARQVLDELRSEFQGHQYNLLTKNCNTFSNELCLRLLGVPIPAYVNRMAYLGSFLSCLLPRELTGQAPVEADSTPTTANTPRASYTSFGGSGISLRGTAPSTDTDEDMEVRREKRRLAAMRRIELMQESS